MNAQYTPSPKQTNAALTAHTESSDSSWFLDSGASTHLTNSLDNLSISTPYHGSDGVTIGDDSSINIANTGAGILPTPSHSQNPLPRTM
ncbi:hypothetical protein MA16_Dca021727 [Dendrobium catenatum]|uniref:Retrovirus-related Pol polyprotein from transposon TNT 1-94-like beta-barrel domain-containing protein n=1 Tax=Dendrobium catenatum TaxID=906689 RepID=A0A2I0WVD6_9ASPA|nr:hypothetical protein MA16_Dca021727 [Dendrobium catenatum]